MLSVLFWFGVIGVIREWRYAKKLGAPLARTEKWYLAGAIVVAFVGSAIGDLTGLFVGLTRLFQTRTSAPFWVAVALIAWTARQTVRRARSHDSRGAVTTRQ